MKLKQVSGVELLSQESRKRLESIYYANLDTAKQVVQREFPNHVVREQAERLLVSVKDCSFNVAIFEKL